MEPMTTRSRPLLALTAFIAALATGCIDTELAADDDAASEAPTVIAYDARGQRAELTELPRRPELVVRTPTGLDLERSPLVLLHGPLDDALARDLMKSPLLAAHETRRVPASIDASDARRIAITPTSILEPHGHYVLATIGPPRAPGGRTLGEAPWSQELRISPASTAGARLLSTWPAARSAGIAPNLLFTAWIFDGEVSGIERGVWVEDAQGFTLPGSSQRVDCAELDARGATCVIFEPSGSLAPLETYVLRTSDALIDSTGAALPPTSTSFSIGDAPDFRPPALEGLECAPDERAQHGMCTLTSDRGYDIRLRVDEPVRVLVRGDAAALPDVRSQLTPAGELALTQSFTDLASPLVLTLSLTDAAGNMTERTLSLQLESDLATLSITELRADPRGKEPAQELVEILNFGDRPVSLLGFSLCDDANDEGAAITTDARVFPGARVLLVPDDFEATSPLDEAPATGATLVRVGKTLTRGGLLNVGETLYLRDPHGRRVSSAPATPKPRAGVCSTRVVDDPRTGAPGSFDYDPSDSCTPGW